MSAPSPPILLALLVFGGYLLAAYLRGFLAAATARYREISADAEAMTPHRLDPPRRDPDAP